MDDEELEVPKNTDADRPRRPRRRTGAVLDAWCMKRPLFTLAEFAKSRGIEDRARASAVLRHHVDTATLFRLKRGLFQDVDFDSCVITAAFWTEDAVLAYDGALHLQRPWQTSLDRAERASILTMKRCKATEGVNLVRPPAALGASWNSDTVELPKGGYTLRATRPERTLVDLLDRLDLSPSAEELWECFALQRLDAPFMISYAQKLGGPLVQARLGSLLQYLPSVPRGSLECLAVPKGPTYFDRARRPKGCVFDRRWNLMIPLNLVLMADRTDFYRWPPVIPKDPGLYQPVRAL